MLYAIIKLPRMCSEFQNAMKKKMSQEANKASQATAVSVLDGLIPD